MTKTKQKPLPQAKGGKAKKGGGTGNLKLNESVEIDGGNEYDVSSPAQTRQLVSLEEETNEKETPSSRNRKDFVESYTGEQVSAEQLFSHKRAPSVAPSDMSSLKKYPTFKAPSRDYYTPGGSTPVAPPTPQGAIIEKYKKEYVPEIPDAFAFTSTSERVDYSLLGEDITWKVFTFLDCISLAKAAQVCKAWHHASLDPTLWRHLRISSAYLYPKAIIRRLAEQYRDTMESICLDYAHRVSDDDLLPLVECTKLYSVQVNYCNQLTDRGVYHLSKISSLTDLGLCGIKMITHRSMQYLNRLEHLRGLSLMWNQQLDDTAIMHISTIRGLTFLDIRGCSNVTDEGIGYLFKTELQTVFMKGTYKVSDMVSHKLMQYLHNNQLFENATHS